MSLALVAALAAGPLINHLTTTPETTAPLATEPSIHPVATPAMAAATPTAPAPAPAVTTAARPAPAVKDHVLAAGDPRFGDQAEPENEKLAELKAAMERNLATARTTAAMSDDDEWRTAALPTQAVGYFSDTRNAAEANRSGPFEAALGHEVAEEGTRLEPARVTQYVNMRAGPSDDAQVLTVVPTNAAIEAETDCRWCEISYDGRTGYVFQSFIAR